MLKVKQPELESTNVVKNKRNLDTSRQVKFTFANFRFEPISIDDKFNNYYKDIEEYIRKVGILIGLALPLLSNESTAIFSDKGKQKKLHLHKIIDKEDILRQIFEKYMFSKELIDNIFEGENLYQLEVPYENGATRIVFQRIDDEISFLFLDPNHHIYFNKKKVEDSKSLFYETCPVNLSGNCIRMDYLSTCFAFDFLDKEKYLSTYDYDYSYEPK